MRAALRDAQSERAGWATQFVDVPDLKKGRIALSGFFMWALNEETAKVLSAGGAPAGTGEGRIEAPDARSGPALRIFRPGAPVVYAFEIYNARRDGKTHLTSVETRMRLFREQGDLDGRAGFALGG